MIRHRECFSIVISETESRRHVDRIREVNALRRLSV